MHTCQAQEWFKYIASLKPLGELSLPYNHGYGETKMDVISISYMYLVCIVMIL